MYLPEISTDTMNRYVEFCHELGEAGAMRTILDEIKNENPGLFKIIEITVATTSLPAVATLIISHHCMQYKLLRMQAETDLMGKLFE